MEGLAARTKSADRSAVAAIALPLKRDLILIGSPTEVNCQPFSAPRESVLSYYSTSGSRSLARHVSRSWGLASLMQALKETSEANRGRMRLAYQDRSVQPEVPPNRVLTTAVWAKLNNS